MNLAELILARCARQPESVAVHLQGETVRYGELAHLIEERAAVLSGRTSTGDVVALTGTTLNVLTSYVAGLLAGRTVSLGPEGAIAATTAVFDGVEVIRPAEAVGKRLETAVASAILFTSGTSGEPKRVLHGMPGLSWGLLNTVSVETELTGASLPASTDELDVLLDRDPYGLGLLCGMPVESIAGISILNRALSMGETLVLPTDLSPYSLWNAISSPIVTTAGIPPIAAQRLLRRARSEKWTEPGLLSLGLGGSRVAPDLARDLERILACPVTSGYGSTELGGVALMSRPWDPPHQRWTTVGTPIGVVDIRLEETESGLEELVVRSPSAMVGMLSPENRISIAPEWIRTGDAAIIGADGVVEIAGRVDYIIQRGGRRIDPSQIEQVLRNHNAVAAVGVLAQPSRVADEDDIWALVQLRDACGVEELARFCREHLRPYQVPRRIVTVDSIPVTSDGVPRRAELPALAVRPRSVSNPRGFTQ
jgi:acyl-coenzyme A synthetase/AMP-(fatty) acid ligase